MQRVFDCDLDVIYGRLRIFVELFIDSDSVGQSNRGQWSEVWFDVESEIRERANINLGNLDAQSA